MAPGVSSLAGASGSALAQNKANSPASAAPAATKAAPGAQNLVDQRFTAWTFGELPELLEIQKGGQTLIGFPALIDVGDAVTIEVFDEPEVAARKHRAGLRADAVVCDRQ